MNSHAKCAAAAAALAVLSASSFGCAAKGTTAPSDPRLSDYGNPTTFAGSSKVSAEKDDSVHGYALPDGQKWRQP
jgi:hypothetical protein